MADVLRILIIEDDSDLRNALELLLKREGYSVEGAGTIAEGMARAERANLILSDIRLPDGDGLDLLKQVKEKRPSVEVIMMTAFGSIDSAVTAIKQGARHYITKPFEMEDLLHHVEEVQELLSLRRQKERMGRGGLLGTSALMRRVYEAIDMAAAGSSTVLITGETGTGKDLAARAIHAASSRKSSSFIPVNLGSLSPEIVESELYGHVKGAFTGAVRAKRGRFLLANRGTLFLDEIDTLPLALQPKILRAIESGKIWPVGGEREEVVDVRIISATNADLEERIEEDAFRADLFYRIKVLTIRMPPLHEHPEDIPLIARSILDQLLPPEEESWSVDISKDALTLLIGHGWPGNVRELRNVLEEALARCTYEEAPPHIIKPCHLSIGPPLDEPPLPFKEARMMAMKRWSRKTILGALAASEGNVTQAAMRLQMNTSALFRLIKKLGIRD